jgi:capsular polysaccharide biosynthesis protein
LNLKAYLTAVRRYWLTFVLTAGVVFALGLSWLLLTPAKFVSSTQLMVSIQGPTTAAAYQNDQVAEARINTYIPLLTSGVVTQRVIDKLKLPMTPAELATRINATNVPPRTTIIDVEVTDESPATAQLLAKTLADEFVSYAEALETPTGEDSHKVRTTVVSTSSEARENRVERILLGVLAGCAALVVGAVAVWIRSRTDPIVRTPAQAAAASGMPVLRCVTATTAASIDGLEEYRRLRAQLSSATRRTGGANDRGGVLMLTSAVDEVDTATIASSLGRAMESTGSRAIVLDARAAGAEVATDQPFAGVASGNEHIRGGTKNTAEPENNKAESNDAAHIDVVAALNSVLSGSKLGAYESPDDSSVSASATDRNKPPTTVSLELIDHLRSEYEHIIIAGPPLVSTTAASTLIEVADEVLLALSIGETTRRDLSRAAEQLRATGAQPTGAVLIAKDEDRLGSDWARSFANTRSITGRLAQSVACAMARRQVFGLRANPRRQLK